MKAAYVLEALMTVMGFDKATAEVWVKNPNKYYAEISVCVEKYEELLQFRQQVSKDLLSF